MTSTGCLKWFSNLIILRFCSTYPCRQNHKDKLWLSLFVMCLHTHTHTQLQYGLAVVTAVIVAWRQTDVWVYMSADMMRCLQFLHPSSVFTFALWCKTDRRGRKPFLNSLEETSALKMYFYSQNLRDTQPKIKLNIIRYQVRTAINFIEASNILIFISLQIFPFNYWKGLETSPVRINWIEYIYLQNLRIWRSYF